MINFLMNLLWFVLLGCLAGIVWIIIGLLWCITIVGIPVGIQCFKLAGLAFWPFGRDVEFGEKASSFLLNILWLIFGGFELALTFMVVGAVFCITVVGIPFGLQWFKLAKLALMPFGAKIK
ncbi:MAG: YccF domain-containing protein [Treponemataceae bacterium]|nr:YccF domain-containing protein [Treponemataceae bacterium]